MCLLRGTDWDFKLDRYSFVLKGLMDLLNAKLYDCKVSWNTENNLCIIMRADTVFSVN